MDVKAAIFDRVDEPRGNKETEGNGNYQVDGTALRLGYLILS